MRIRPIILTVIFFNLTFANSLNAQTQSNTENEPVDLFITANRTETQIDDIGRSVEKISKKEIENLEVHTLTESVQDVSGVRMMDLGGPGAPGTTPVEIRGYGTKGTQILYNGLTLSDPSSISGSFESFFSYLNVDDIQSVEVMKGGAGVLYGSDAQGGVINMIPEKPVLGRNFKFTFEGGSYDTFTEVVGVNAGGEKGGIVASASHTDSGGLDANGNFGNTNASIVGELEIVEDLLSVTPIFKIISAENDLDSNPTLDENKKLIPNQDKPEDHLDATAWVLGSILKNTPEGRFENQLSVYTVQTDRDFHFDFDGFDSDSEFQGSSFNVDLQTTIDIPEAKSTLVSGFEYENQGIDTDSDGTTDSSKRDQFAIFLHDNIDLIEDIWTFSTGARGTAISNTSKFVSTLEAATSIKVPQTNSRFHSSVAQGFRAPTLFESDGKITNYFEPGTIDVGNDNLNEEESISYDFGFEQKFLEGSLIADVTFFQIDADETILFDFENLTHVNGGDTKTQGIETSLTYQPLSELIIRAAYTNLDTAEGIDGERRQRTPRNWFAITSTYGLFGFNLSSQVRYRDSQNIAFYGEPELYKESDVTILDLAVSKSLTSNIELFVRTDNVFDVDYTEAGYTMPGFSAFAGMKLRM
jgi:vitamin B12 transporter